MEDNNGTAEVVDRKEGYYWVRYGSNWEVARFIGGYWFTIGGVNRMESYDFNEIDERRICRS